METYNKLPFLDILLSKKEGKLGFQVFRKKTCMQRYLHANSHHHPKQKIGIIKTLTTRAARISDCDHLNFELNHPHKVFEQNGYNKKTINKAKHQSLNKNIQNNKDKEHKYVNSITSLPYIKGTIDKISKILNKNNINVAFIPLIALDNFLNLSRTP